MAMDGMKCLLSLGLDFWPPPARQSGWGREELKTSVNVNASVNDPVQQSDYYSLIVERLSRNEILFRAAA